MEFQRPDDARRLFFEMPKPELHLHLDGSLDPATRRQKPQPKEKNERIRTKRGRCEFAA